MEDNLDSVELGEKDWKKVIADFYKGSDATTDPVFNNYTNVNFQFTKKWEGSSSQPETAYFYIEGRVNPLTKRPRGNNHVSTNIVAIAKDQYENGKSFTFNIVLPKKALRDNKYLDVVYTAYEIDISKNKKTVNSIDDIDLQENGIPKYFIDWDSSDSVCNGYVVTYSKDLNNQVITNRRDMVLPETGGRGTRTYAMFGTGALIAAALASASILISRRKKK